MPFRQTRILIVASRPGRALTLIAWADSVIERFLTNSFGKAVALEEPEYGLAPQYLGRIIRKLRGACSYGDIQSLITTHAPALLRRVDLHSICFLRLSAARAIALSAHCFKKTGTGWLCGWWRAVAEFHHAMVWR